MSHLPTDRGIPILTQRADPAPSPPAPLAAIPLLTEVAHGDEPAYADTVFPLSTAAESVARALPAPAAADQPDHACGLPPAPVLAARLQAELEQAMHLALVDAIEQIQTRMDEILPDIVARVLQDLKPG